MRAEVRPWEGVRFGAELQPGQRPPRFQRRHRRHHEPVALHAAARDGGLRRRKDVQLFARAENILNQVYEEPEGFQAPYFQAFFGVKAKF